MHITGTTLAVSAAMPVFLAVCLIWGLRRCRLLSTLALVFLFGGFASLLLALVAARLLIPVEAFVTAGAPNSVRAGLASAFLTAAFPEELARLVISLCVIAVLRNSAGREVILTCGMIGLGFAMFENILYSLTVPFGSEIGIGRAIPTVFHGTSALIMGSLLERATSHRGRLRSGLLLIALTVPILLHALYDFGAFLFEVIDFPDLPDDPSFADLKPLGAAFATLALVSSIILIELIWVARILLGIRRTSQSR